MTQETRHRHWPLRRSSLLVISVVLVGVLLARCHNYLLFHSLAELFSIALTFGVFTLFWNARRFLDNGFFLLIGIASLFVGFVDLLHTLAYDQMGVFDAGPNLATQLWLAGRFIQASTFLAAPLFLRQHFDARLIFAVYAITAAALLASIFAWEIFPTCFVAGEGLTTFKIASEYAIGLVMAVGLALLAARREDLDIDVFRLLGLTIGATIASEIAFTIYDDVTGMANLIGHLLKLLASYLMYVAFVEVGLTSPYSVLFRNLRESERELREINETLEERVAERTLVAERRARQLRALASELTLTEQRERRRLAQTLHDHLQQLLVAAKLKVGILAKRAADQKQRDRLGRVGQLLDESIDVSRSLTVELCPPVLYDAGFGAALDWLARRMQEKHGCGVTVRMEAGAEPATDDLRVFLFDAVRELLFNVVKHAGTRKATVRVALAGDETLRVTVEDEGVGLADDALQRDAQNPGFGLFSIRERLALLGGRMEIDSAGDRGTRVILTVKSPRPAPSGRAEGRQGDGGRKRPAAAGDDFRPHEVLRVLLADDHPMFRRGLANLLGEYPDLEIVGEAGDGQAAIQLAEQVKPDVVVMDVVMPQMNGLEATRRLLQAMPAVRVIALSMYEEGDMAQAMLDSGAATYLRKDGSLERLVAAIRGADQAAPLDAARRRSAGPGPTERP
ncbi:MAG: MASE3 domain-containing protein [Planctomycetota bacterium]|nr:MASE3 domain-containing protein [Planctomycetota bacterium]